MKILTEITLKKAKLQIITMVDRPDIFFGRFFIFPVKISEIDAVASEIITLANLAKAHGFELNILTKRGNGK